MTISRVENYGASLRQEGRVTNEDAFLLGRGCKFEWLQRCRLL